MSTRKDFIRNSLLALCASMLPKVLQPSVPELVKVPVNFEVQMYTWDEPSGYNRTKTYGFQMTFKVPEDSKDDVREYLKELYNSKYEKDNDMPYRSYNPI